MLNRPERSMLRPADVEEQLIYYGTDLATAVQIVETILRLPAEVAEFAAFECRYASVGTQEPGLTLPPTFGPHEADSGAQRWFIILSEDVPVEDAASVIAHEIAHAWLGHEGREAEPQDCAVAAAYAGSWGFTGASAIPR